MLSAYEGKNEVMQASSPQHHNDGNLVSIKPI